MIVSYIGNGDPPHSTENHVASAWRRLGHSCTIFQENIPETWTDLDRLLAADLILWTRTGWDWSSCGWSTEEAWEKQDAMLDAAQTAGVPTVGFHLDRWWGLDREGQVHDEPFFRCDVVCTADGGHQAEFAEAGINHVWLPPGVSLAETERVGRPLPRQYPGHVAFVGSHHIRRNTDGSTTGYHDEWGPHRLDMLDACRNHFGRRFQLYPRGKALRGQPLADLYATIPVLVGDSCLAPFDNPPTHYWSDRIPETLGRGGILVHPWVDGLDEQFGPILGAGLRTLPIGNYGEMLAQLHDVLALSPETRLLHSQTAREYVQEHHTYERRVEQLIAISKGLTMGVPTPEETFREPFTTTELDPTPRPGKPMVMVDREWFEQQTDG